jgi:selenocysteine lyase/cysteine desulfurase
LAERLAQHNVHVSARGDWIRISPHLYNDEQDLEGLLRPLREFGSEYL